MNRVVVTGLGVLAPNAHGIEDFEKALREGRSGIRHIDELAELRFGCHVGGAPADLDRIYPEYFQPEALSRMNSAMRYSAIAAIDCWRDAGFERPDPDDDEVEWDTGAVVGTGLGGVDTLASKVIPTTDAGKIRRLGGTTTEQVMTSAVSANVGGILGLGGPVTTNSCACTTGTESVILAMQQVGSGRIKRMLAGGVEAFSRYIWSGLDAMRVLTRDFNDRPEEASRPMSASASGFVPACGAGFLLLESLDSALERGAHIHAEVLGGYLNSGGQRQGGSITAPNSDGVQRCIRGALADAGIDGDAVDTINGHLTATMADPLELQNWRIALDRPPEKMPWINSTKSLVGHALGAAGGIETVAAMLQLSRSFLHGSVNCEDVHPQIEPFADRIVHETRSSDARILAKASFGFGDVNGCLIFKKWNPRKA
jgi:3-oxoacyl-(acyl-carrier-protein) synthase